MKFILLVLMFFSGLDGWVIGTLIQYWDDEDYWKDGRGFAIGVAAFLTIIVLYLARCVITNRYAYWL